MVSLKNEPIDIAWIAIVLCGVPILVGAFKGVVFEHDVKADLLVAMALIASVVTKEYFAAGEVALIMQIGSLLEDYTSGKAGEGIQKPIHISPQKARVLRDDAVAEIPVEEVRVGDILSVLAGIGNAAKYGVIVRSGDALERLSKIKVIAFDKTGTLTYGKPQVTSAKACPLS